MADAPQVAHAKIQRGLGVDLRRKSFKNGAALLAARGAMRAGAGLVTLATWPEVVATLDAKLPEVMVTAIAESALDALMDRKSAIVFGLASESMRAPGDSRFICWRIPRRR